MDRDFIFKWKYYRNFFFLNCIVDVFFWSKEIDFDLLCVEKVIKNK